VATLINLGFAGINADYIACWEDDPACGELYVTLAVPALDVVHGGTHHLVLTYREEQRVRLLQYLECPHP